MAIKSLTITEKAYNALKAMKHENESFSEVIIRVKKKQAIAVERYVGILKLGDKELKETLARLKQRREETGRDAEKRSKEIRKIVRSHGTH